MKKLILMGFLLASSIAISQTTTAEPELDLISAPSSPGFILLNQQPTDIERPASPTDLAVSVRNSSSNFSAFPKNYAVEMAPAWLFFSEKIRFDSAYGPLSHKNKLRNIAHTFNLSMAYAPVDSLNAKGASQFGFGFKCSIIRGKINPEFTDKTEQLKKILLTIGKESKRYGDSAKLRDPVYIAAYTSFTNALQPPVDEARLERARKGMDSVDKIVGDRLAKTFTSKSLDAQKELIKDLGEIQVMRTGFFVDLAGGSVLDFPTREFDYSEINKYGAWLNLGWDEEKWSLIGMGRFLRNKKIPSRSDSTVKINDANILDFGLRAVYKKDQFEASLEGIYRTYHAGGLPPAFKSTFYLSYNLGDNKVLSLNVSRDFDGTLDKKGTLVTALNLVIGLGSKRKYNP